MNLEKLHRRIRIVWASAGVGATLALAWTFQAHGVPPGTMSSGPAVAVREGEDRIEFRPCADTLEAAVLFFPGGMVQPVAYAPLARAVAEAGYPAVIVRLPFLGRHAPTEASRAEAIERARAIVEEGDAPGPGRVARGRSPAGGQRRWVVAGHSLGGALAAEFARAHPRRTAGLVLIATTHPRDFDLSAAAFPVTKIVGTRDGVASPAKIRRNAGLLPPSTRVVLIQGANHAQFGHYGPQLLDHRARTSRAEQQRRVVEELIRILERTAAAAGPVISR